MNPAPQFDAPEIGPPRGIGHHHEAGQALALGPQPVAQPGPQARLADHDVARVHLQAARGMRGRIGVHRADHAQIVREPGRVREQAADLQPALAVLGERERRLHQVADRAAVGADRCCSAGRREPWYFSSAGLRSNVSTWLGAPFMKRKTTCLARAGKWGGLGDIRYGCAARGRLRRQARRPARAARRSPIATAGRSNPGRQSRRRPPRETPGASGRTASDWE